MNTKNLLLKDVAKLLKVKPYRITYALVVGLVPEPAIRINNKRIFQEHDIHRLAKHFGVELGEKHTKEEGESNE